MESCSCKRSFISESDYFRNTTNWRQLASGDLEFECNCGALGRLVKGQHHFFSDVKTLYSEDASVLNFLSLKEKFPYNPEPILRMQKELSSKNCDIALLANLLESAPLLWAQIYQKAAKNNAAKIESTKDLLESFTKKTLRNMIDMAAIRAYVPDPSIYRAKDFFASGKATSEIAKHLAKEYAPHLDLYQLALASHLLHLGKLVTLTTMPKVMEKISLFVLDAIFPVTWSQAQERLHLPSHEVLGQIAAAIWGMPDFVKDAINSQSKIEKKGPITLGEASGLASQIYLRLSYEDNLIDEYYLEKVLGRFKIDFGKLENLITQLEAA